MLLAVSLMGGARAAPVAGLPASGLPQVALHVSFTPDRLGQSTTIHWGFTIAEPEPLRSIELRLPAGMGFAHSSLGIEECEPARLAEAGPEGCPIDSLVGRGSALAEVPAQSTVFEQAKVTAVLGPYDGEQTTVLFFVDGKWPVNREVIMVAHVAGAAPPYGEALLTEVPELTAWAEGPYIGVIHFTSTIGPEGLTYYRRAQGRTIAFRPRGLSVPARCPRAGFPIAAVFTWWNLQGSATARTMVPCPRQAPAPPSRGPGG